MTSLLLWSGGRRARTALALLTLTAGAVAVAPSRGLWVGIWKFALDQGTGSLLLIGCVCAGAAAYTYGTMDARHWGLFVGGTRRGLTGWLGPLAGLWILGVVGMVTCTAVLLSVAAANGAEATPVMLWAVPLVTPALAAEVSLGALLGVTLPRTFSVPLATVLPFFLEGFSHGGTLPGIFRTGGVTGPLAGETYSWRVILLAASTCGALAIALVLLLSLQVLQGRRRWTVAGLVGAFACVPALWWTLESQGNERYVFQAEPAIRCAGAAPEVCISADTTRPLRGLAREAHRQATLLRALGIEVPARFSQQFPGHPNDFDGRIPLTRDQVGSAEADPWLVSLALATPRACPEYSTSADPRPALQVQRAMALWINRQAGGRSPAAIPGSPEATWLEHPDDTQRQWVVDTYAALRTCRLHDVHLPYDSLW